MPCLPDTGAGTELARVHGHARPSGASQRGRALNKFFQELRRRNVFRVAGVYAVVGWLLIQVIVAVTAPLGLPDWTDTFFIVLVLAGFPIAVLFAWAFEMTPDGMKRTADVPEGESIAPKTGSRLDFVIIAALLLVGALVIGDRLMPGGSGPQGTGRAAKDGASASVAVLPFIDLSPDGDQEFFSDGISEEILNVLVRIPNLKVAGRTSSFSFKGQDKDLRAIGAALGVENVLEGSVRKSGEKLRITAQLIRSSDGFHIWSETYDRELTDVFDIQDDIAKSVAAELALSLGLTSGETLVTDRTDDIVAYEKYLKARQLYLSRGLENLDSALLLLHEVVARDPNFVPAWSTIAGIYSVYESYQPQFPPTGDYHQWRAVGQAAARRAIALDPGNAEAHVYLGALQIYEGDLIAGAANIDKAVELAPENATVLDTAAQELVLLGYGDEAVDLARRAVAADPLVPIYRNSLGYIVSYSGDLAGIADPRGEALEHFAKAREYGPNVTFTYVNSYRTYVEMGRYDEAEGVLMAAIDKGLVPESALEPTKAILAPARKGDAGKAELRSLYASANPFQKPIIADLLNDPALVADSFEPVWKADYQAEPQLFLVATQSTFQHPAWKAQVRKYGVLDLWKSRGFPSWCKPVGKDDFECTR